MTPASPPASPPDEPALHEPALHEPALHEPALHEPALHEPALHEPALHRDDPADAPADDKPPTSRTKRASSNSRRKADADRADADRAAANRADELARVGLTPGEEVRFRRRVSARWIPATVERLERDGSVGLRDPKGAAVALTVDRIEVRTEGPRGRLLWEPLTSRLARNEQLRLL